MNQEAFEHFQKGIGFQERGFFDVAVQEYEKALKLEPGNIDILLNCGAACLQRGWVEKAIELLVRVLEQDTDNTLALYNLGKAFLYSEDHEAALEVFRRLVKLSPEDKDVKKLIAISLRQIGKFREAVEINLGLLDYLEDSLEALLELAGDLKMLNRFEEAITVYRRASEKAVDSVDPFIGMYSCFMKIGNTEKAVAALKRAILIEPCNQALVIMLVDVNLNDGKIQEAANIITKAMETIPDAELLWEKYNEMVRRLPVLKKKNVVANYVNTYSKYETEVYDILDALYDGRVKLDLALREFEALRSREPNDLLIADELANIYFQARQYDKAAEIYSDLLINYPEKPKHRIDLAKSLTMKGDLEASRTILKDSIRDLGHIPEFELAIVELDLYDKDFEKAAARLEMVLKEYPDEAHALFLYAYTAIRLNEFEIAEKAFGKLFAGGHYDEELAVWYSRLCIIRGNYDIAFKIWNSFSDGMESLVEIISRVELTLAAGDSRGILKYLQKIGEYHPRFIEDHMLFGKAFFFAGDFVAAQREFDMVLKYEPKNAEALAMSAMSSLIRNKLSKFWSYWQQATTCDSLYAMLPVLILKNSFNFTQRERLRQHTQKTIEIMNLNKIERDRLMYLIDILGPENYD
jgi:tetratricopeptide (TPR) repeat protein